MRHAANAWRKAVLRRHPRQGRREYPRAVITRAVPGADPMTPSADDAGEFRVIVENSAAFNHLTAQRKVKLIR